VIRSNLVSPSTCGMWQCISNTPAESSANALRMAQATHDGNFSFEVSQHSWRQILLQETLDCHISAAPYALVDLQSTKALGQKQPFVVALETIIQQMSLLASHRRQVVSVQRPRSQYKLHKMSKRQPCANTSWDTCLHKQSSHGRPSVSPLTQHSTAQAAQHSTAQHGCAGPYLAIRADP
jgi:hypothetical protein